MLRPRNRPVSDPEQPVSGVCPACGTVVTTVTGKCQYRSDPAMGERLCIGCPRVVTTYTDGREPLVCGSRIHVAPIGG